MTPDPDHTTRFDIHVQYTGSVCVLSVSGDLDLETAPQLRGAVSAAGTDGATTLVIDLTGVTFLASTGLSVLVDAASAMSAPRRLAVVAAGTVTRRPLLLVGLDQVLSIHPTRTAALAASL